MRKLVLCLMAGALFLAACGDSTESTTADPDDTPTSEGSADTTAAPTTAAPTTAAPTFGLGSDWCEGAREIDMRSDEIEAEGLGFVVTFERQFRELLPMQLELASSAPDEIADDVATFTDGMMQMRDLLEQYDYNILNIPEAELAILDDPVFTEASDNIDAYNETVCDLDVDGDADGTDSGPVLTEADVDAMLDSPQRDAILGPLLLLGFTEEQAECAMRVALVDDLDTSPSNPAFLEALTNCGVSIEDLARLGSTGSTDGDVNAENSPEIQALLDVIPLVAGNPAAAQALVDGFTSAGIPEIAADCMGDALSAPDAATTFVDAGSFFALLDDCGVALTDLVGAAG